MGQRAHAHRHRRPRRVCCAKKRHSNCVIILCVDLQLLKRKRVRTFSQRGRSEVENLVNQYVDQQSTVTGTGSIQRYDSLLI